MIDIDSIAVGSVTAHADAFAVIAENGKGYFRVALDPRGRQYAVGSVNHFDSGTLALFTGSDLFADEVVEKAKGFTLAKGLKALDSLAAGDITAAAAFFTKKVGKLSSGKTVFKYSLNTSLLSAVITIAANLAAAKAAA